MEEKKEKFKTFVSHHPELVSFIKRKEMTWQDFYEIYDIYGEDDSAWNQYFSADELESDTNTKDKVSELTSIFKNVNMDSIQRHVNNAQKAINIIQELTKKSPEVVSKTSRPITKFYGD